MKTVIAIDSYKGSLTSLEAAGAAASAVRSVTGGDTVIVPVADGGEGTVEALVEGLGGTFEKVTVIGPDGSPAEAVYGILDNGTAVMEMAQASGITLMKQLDPWNATTYGTGQMIRDAIEKGCRRFIIGIGGSATTDGGAGMLQALGYSFRSKDGREITYGIGSLDEIVEISDEQVLPQLKECTFEVACDVENPLCGETGAVYVFGPQKGVKDSEKAILDRKMAHYADVTAAFTGRDRRDVPGAGAAGGMGFAFSAYFENAVLKSGIDIVLEATGLETHLADADLVITGEGRLDGQTAMGKVPVGIARLAKKYNVEAVAFAGCLGEGAELCLKEGIDRIFAVTPEGMALEEAMKKNVAQDNIKKAVEAYLRKEK